jgi:energy-coupling factor transporter ATP-binding protein EcfA2
MQEELRELWQRFRKTVVFVTHDVREAVFLSQRVVVMSARPGRIKTIIETGLGPDATRAAIDAKADELWDLLRDEVVRTIAEEGRGLLAKRCALRFSICRSSSGSPYGSSRRAPACSIRRCFRRSAKR